MPLYEYECKKCHDRFERIQKFSDPYVKKCPDCGGPVELVVSAPAVQFKGSGWYVNDYAKKSSATSSKTDSGSKAEGSDKSDSESKGESDSQSSKEDKSKQDSSGSSKKTAKKTSSSEKS